MKRLSYQKVICALLLLCSPVLAQINGNGDTQFWYRQAVEKKWNESWSTEISNEYRLGNDISKMYFTYVEGLLKYRPAKWLEVAPGYRQTWHRGAAFGWRAVYIPIAQAELRGGYKGWRFFNRNRVQFDVAHKAPNIWLYRNRFVVQTPPIIWKMRLFMEDEVFVRERVGWSQNRLIGGALFEYTPHLRMSLAYMLRNIKIQDEWRAQNVLRASVTFAY